jgi:hypothetical protein
MPDMQTALKEALNEWSDSAGRHQVEKQQPTPLPEATQMQTATQITPTPRGRVATPENESVRRDLFNHIKGNPESSLQDLVECGYEHGSASTHLSLLYFNGKLSRKAVQVQRPIYGGRIATRDVFVYSAAVNEYDDVPAMLPNKKAKKIRVHKKIKQGDAAQPAQGIAALPTDTAEIKPAQGILRSERIPRPPMQTFVPHPELAELIKPPRIALTASYVIDNISLSEAVLLHAELKKMLG